MNMHHLSYFCLIAIEVLNVVHAIAVALFSAGHRAVPYARPVQVPGGVAAGADSVVPGGTLHAAGLSRAIRQRGCRKVSYVG